MQRPDLLPMGERGRCSGVSNAAARGGENRQERREGGAGKGAYLALPVESWTLARIRLSSSAWSSAASARLSSGRRQCCCCCLGSGPQAGESRERYCESGGVVVGGGAWAASPGPALSRKLPAMGEEGGIRASWGPPRRLIERGAAHRMPLRGRLRRNCSAARGGGGRRR